jgi:hypothetical protein
MAKLMVRSSFLRTYKFQIGSYIGLSKYINFIRTTHFALTLINIPDALKIAFAVRANPYQPNSAKD